MAQPQPIQISEDAQLTLRTIFDRHKDTERAFLESMTLVRQALQVPKDYQYHVEIGAFVPGPQPETLHEVDTSLDS